MQLLKQLISVVIITAILYLLGYRPAPNLMSTLYTVSGIFFSIGLSLIIAFDLSPIRNINYLISIRAELATLRNTYIKCFAASTFIYLFFSYAADITVLHIHDIDLLSLLLNISLSMQLFVILFFIINFIEIQRFKDEISDRIRSELEE